MQSNVKTLITLGVHPNLSFCDKRELIFMNQANLTLVVCSLFVMLINLMLGFYARMIVPAGVLLFFIGAFLLQGNRKYLAAKIMMIAGAFSSGFMATLLFGGSAKTQFYCFASFVLGMIILRSFNHRVLLTLVHLGGFAFMQYQINYGQPFIAGYDHALLAYFHVPIVFLCIFIAISEFMMNFQRFEKRINSLIESTREHSALIEMERVKYQAQSKFIQATNNQLQQEIEQREKIQKELVDSNTSLGQFAYVASHDLKEPLRTIGSFSQILRRKLQGKLEKDTQEYLGFMIDGVARMSNLLDDLLALSKLDQDFELTKVDLNRCLELTKLNLRNALEKNNGTILSVDLPVINANRLQVNQLLQNLISNGLKFSRDVSPIVEINYEEQESFHLFAVKDNGIGIDAAYQDKIFSVFQRLHKKSEFEGTGIGLSICKKVVQNHGGNIWVESTPGEGTTFYFTIAKTTDDNSQVEPAQINTQNILSDN